MVNQKNDSEENSLAETPARSRLSRSFRMWSQPIAKLFLSFPFLSFQLKMKKINLEQHGTVSFNKIFKMF